MMLDILKQHLIDLDYPNINAMNDEQVADIFALDYLQIYLKWFVGKLVGDELEDVVKILKAFGFSLPEMKPFPITADALEALMKTILSMLEQLKTNLKETDESTLATMETSTETSNLENRLDEIVTSDIDLFPNFGGKKHYTKPQRQQHVETLNADMEILEQQIKHLESELENCPENGKMAATKCTPSSGVINDIENFSSVCAHKLAANLQNAINVNQETIPQFSDAFPDKLQHFSKKAMEAEQYLNCLDTLETLNLSTGTTNLTGNNEEYAMFIQNMIPITLEL